MDYNFKWRRLHFGDKPVCLNVEYDNTRVLNRFDFARANRRFNGRPCLAVFLVRYSVMGKDFS